MKRYFTKLVPIDHLPLKEGDQTLWPKDQEGFFAGQICPVVKSNLFHLTALGCKPWKMCLCTREIEKDDIVFAEPEAVESRCKFKVVELETLEGGYLHSVIEYVEHPINLFIGHQREWPGGNLWKVKGEVSPEAKWIKGGEEFDEEEIQFWKCFPRDTYRLLGCCGHFH